MLLLGNPRLVGPGLQPDCRITREQVLSHVLCVTPVTAAKDQVFCRTHVEGLIAETSGWLQRTCNLIVNRLLS
jgi:hypothetical protein